MDAYQNLISGDKPPWEGQHSCFGWLNPNNDIIRKIDRKNKILHRFSLHRSALDMIRGSHRDVGSLYNKSAIQLDKLKFI